MWRLGFVVWASKDILSVFSFTYKQALAQAILFYSYWDANFLSFRESITWTFPQVYKLYVTLHLSGIFVYKGPFLDLPLLSIVSLDTKEEIVL